MVWWPQEQRDLEALIWKYRFMAAFILRMESTAKDAVTVAAQHAQMSYDEVDARLTPEEAAAEEFSALSVTG